MSDLIERLLSRDLRDDAFNIRLRHEAADELERLTAERRWIPVEERLPDDYHAVIVHREGLPLILAMRVKGCWTTDLMKAPLKGVERWTELPPPPEEKP